MRKKNRKTRKVFFVRRKTKKFSDIFVCVCVWKISDFSMSTTTIARACSPKLILDISNHNIGATAGHMLGMRMLLFHLHLHFLHVQKVILRKCGCWFWIWRRFSTVDALYRWKNHVKCIHTCMHLWQSEEKSLNRRWNSVDWFLNVTTKYESKSQQLRLAAVALNFSWEKKRLKLSEVKNEIVSHIFDTQTHSILCRSFSL